MSNSNEICQYRLDPSDPETWGGKEKDQCQVENELLDENDTWSCSRVIGSSEKFCIFHQDSSETDEELSRDAFIQEIRDTSNQDKVSRLIGARFGTLDLTGADLDEDVVERIDLRHATFEKEFRGTGIDLRADLVLDGSEIKQGFLFDGANISELSFEDVTCGGDMDCRRVNISGKINLANADVDGGANFEQAERIGGMFLENTNIGRGLFLNDIYSDSDIEMNMSTIECGFGCLDSIIEGDVGVRNGCYIGEEGMGFDDTEVHGSIEVINSRISGNLDANQTEVTGDFAIVFTEVDGSASFEDCNVEMEVVFGESSVSDGYVFTDSCIEQGLTLENVEANKTSFRNAQIMNGSFKKSVLSDSDFSDAKLTGSDFQEARLDHSDFEGANLSNTNLEQAKISGSDLFGANLSGARIYGVQIGDVVVNTDTTFDRYGKNRCVYDPNSTYEYEGQSEDEMVGQFRKAMGSYHAFEQLTRANTLPDKQASFFVRRQDMRRAQLSYEESFPRLNYRFSQVQNTVFRYGESFKRVLLWSVGTILLFAIIYPLGGWLRTDSKVITYSTIVDSPIWGWRVLHHSALQFLAGSGPLDTTDIISEVFVTIQTAVAPVLIALLVFVLGRRAAR